MVCNLALKHPPEMTYISSNHIVSAKANHVIMANIKGVGKYNTIPCPE